MNFFAITLGMIDRPAQAMKAVVAKPRSWLIPAILIVLGALALLYVSQPYAIKMADERQAQMIERLASQVSEEQAKAMRDSVRPLTGQMYWLSGLAGSLLIAGLGWAARGAVVHFSSMAAGGQSVWGPTFAVGVWSMLPYFIRSVVQTVYVLINKGIMEHSGLSFLVASGDLFNDTRNWKYLALAQVDPFVLWHIVLLGIGIGAATKLSRGKGTFMAAIIWLIFAALQIAPALVGMAMMGNVGQ